MIDMTMTRVLKYRVWPTEHKTIRAMILHEIFVACTMATCVIRMFGQE